MSLPFALFEVELSRLNDWVDRHSKSRNCPYVDYSGAIGGNFTYSFTPTSIGSIVKVKCSCGDWFDATDYDYW